MIATIITTHYREVACPLPPSRFSRQFSRQSVVSAEARLREIPTKLATLRDTLLPKLPTRELRIAELQI